MAGGMDAEGDCAAAGGADGGADECCGGVVAGGCEGLGDGGGIAGPGRRRGAMNGMKAGAGGTREGKGLRLPWWAAGLALALGYAGWIGVGLMRQGRALEQQLAAARASAPRPADVEAERVRVMVLERELAEVRAGVDPLRQELSRLAGTWTNTAARLEGAEALAGLWSRHGLRLEEHVVVTGDAALTPALQQLVDRARVVVGKGQHPALWEVRLRGAYLAMLGALEELARSDLAAVPMSLEMRPVEGRNEKEWRVRLWQ